jgi:hypothetical protein
MYNLKDSMASLAGSMFMHDRRKRFDSGVQVEHQEQKGAFPAFMGYSSNITPIQKFDKKV